MGACPALRIKGKAAGAQQHLALGSLEAVGGRSGIAELNSRCVGVTRAVAPTHLSQEVLTKHWGLCNIPQSLLERELADVPRTNPNIFFKLRATP